MALNLRQETNFPILNLPCCLLNALYVANTADKLTSSPFTKASVSWTEGNGGLLNAKESFVHSFDTAWIQLPTMAKVYFIYLFINFAIMHTH